MRSLVLAAVLAASVVPALAADPERIDAQHVAAATTEHDLLAQIATSEARQADLLEKIYELGMRAALSSVPPPPPLPPGWARECHEGPMAPRPAMPAETAKP